MLKVISGGQIGADIAALRTATKFKLETGGTAPQGWRTLVGPNPELADYGLVEHYSTQYVHRTFENVKNSDATLRIAFNLNSRGERCTLRALKKFAKPHFDIMLNSTGQVIYPVLIPNSNTIEDFIYAWIVVREIKVLNVAGNARYEIEPFVEEILTRVFTQLAA